MLQRAVLRRTATWVGLSALAFAGGALTQGLAHAGAGPYDVLRDLARALVLIENEYVDPVERTRLLEGAVKGMVGELDPHSAYLPPEDFAIFEADTRGEFAGIGIEVDFQNETVVVVAPIEGSPAERAGILPGDRIVAIDGSPVRGKDMRELVRRMRGKPGTRIVISVSRAQADALRHISLTREVIHVSSIAAKELAHGVLYVRVKQFQAGTHTEFLERVGDAREAAGSGIRGVLLDLRNNPGGLVDEAVAVADELLTTGVIYTTGRRGRTVDEVHASSGGALSREPLIVLVNEHSASAAELVAGALQDHGRATVVGARTFGKGSVQSIVDLPGGSGMRLTTMRYYTPRGHAIQARGIKPDIEVGGGKPGATFGLLRESDLPNHLAAEGEPGAAPSEASPTRSPPPDGGIPSLRLGATRDVPRDPSGGKDQVLSVAFQLLMKRLGH